MFDRLGTGWELTKQSFRVLRLDKELLLFPIVSGLACLVVLASFLLPLWNSPYADVILKERQVPNDPVAYLILFAFYFVNYFVILYFNAALVACAIIRLKGANPTLGDGFRAATACLPQILGWALVTATVGMILKLIESRSEKVGQFVSALLGAAWSVMTYFVVPILVVERKGPVDSLKRSLAILRQTWGEALTANFGISSVLFLVALLPMLLAGGLGVWGIASESAALAIVGFGLLVLMFLVLSLVSSTLHTIILAALYVYASEGKVPEAFEGDLLQTAFQSK
jgi:hypothetical protein